MGYGNIPQPGASSKPATPGATAMPTPELSKYTTPMTQGQGAANPPAQLSTGQQNPATPLAGFNIPFSMGGPTLGPLGGNSPIAPSNMITPVLGSK